MDSVQLCHSRSKQLSQCVKGLFALNTFGSKPSEQRVENFLATVPLVIDAFGRSLRLDHELADSFCSPSAEQRQDFRFDREYRGALVGFEFVPFGRLNSKGAGSEIKAFPFEQIRFPAPEPEHQGQQKSFELFGSVCCEFSGSSTEKSLRIYPAAIKFRISTPFNVDSLKR
jgi:hypothetical protein